MIDLWNPRTFSPELRQVLADQSELISNYHIEAKRLMDEHLNSSPYQSLEPNRFGSNYISFQENTLTPILAGVRVRTWHYSRLLDHEVNEMQQQLVPSSLGFLKQRLDALVARRLLTRQEADIVFKSSPFQAQGDIRSERFWIVTVPVHCSDPGVVPLLGSWGGESAYFWLKDASLAARLKNLGSPRILEIETSLSDRMNAFAVSRTVLEAWAREQGVAVVPSGCDLSITGCISTAKVVEVHSTGEQNYEAIGKTYPAGVGGI